jgi:hypothetical protein
VAGPCSRAHGIAGTPTHPRQSATRNCENEAGKDGSALEEHDLRVGLDSAPPDRRDGGTGALLHDDGVGVVSWHLHGERVWKGLVRWAQT